MFSAKYRLRHEKDIVRAVRSKRGAFDTVCGVKMVPNAEGHPRFAIVIGTKVSKRAVDRNKLRRQYREILKPLLSKIGAFDIALLVSRPALELSFDEMRERLERTLAKAKVYAD